MNGTNAYLHVYPTFYKLYVTLFSFAATFNHIVKLNVTSASRIFYIFEINFSDMHDRVSATIDYGTECKALKWNAEAIASNESALRFAIPTVTLTASNICFIVTTKNGSQVLSIQGDSGSTIIGIAISNSIVLY